MSNQPLNIDFSKIVLPTGTFSSQVYGSTKHTHINIVDSIDKLTQAVDIDDVLQIITDKIGIPSNDVIRASKWSDINFDEMDEIEFIMEMEKKFDCAINDDVANQITQMSPSAFCNLLRSKKRNDKLNDLGI